MPGMDPMMFVGFCDLCAETDGFLLQGRRHGRTTYGRVSFCVLLDDGVARLYRGS